MSFECKNHASALQFYASGFGSLIGFSLFLGYGMLIIQTTAEGRNKAPDWPDVESLGDLARPVLLACATAFVAFAPASWASPSLGRAMGRDLRQAGTR